MRERTVCSAFSINKSLRLSGSAFWKIWFVEIFSCRPGWFISTHIFFFTTESQESHGVFLLMSSRVKRSVAKDLECIAQPSQWMFPRSFLPVGRQGEIEKLCGTLCTSWWTFNTTKIQNWKAKVKFFGIYFLRKYSLKVDYLKHKEQSMQSQRRCVLGYGRMVGWSVYFSHLYLNLKVYLYIIIIYIIYR